MQVLCTKINIARDFEVAAASLTGLDDSFRRNDPRNTFPGMHQSQSVLTSCLTEDLSCDQIYSSFTFLASLVETPRTSFPP